MKNLNLMLIFTFCFSFNLMSQNPDALVDIESTTQGLLFPRVNLVDKSNPSPMNAHVEGMIVFNLTDGGVYPNSIINGFYYNTGTNWERLINGNSNGQSYGDVKHGFQTTDHDGWYLLDGRDLTNLPSNAALATNDLGFMTMLPDASNKVLTNRGAINTTGGDDFLTLSQSNIPNYLITGFTASGGLHNHTVDPPNVNTTTNGNHNHNIKTAVDDASGPESQGYPSGNNQSRI